MHLWHELTTLAVLGTERQREALRAEGSLGEVLARIYPPSVALTTLPRDRALLDAIAVLALYQRSGRLPAPASAHQPAACEAETRPALGSQGAFTLSVLLTDKDKRALLPEYLALVASRGQRVPFTLLPPLLDAGRQERGLRPLIVAVMGARGAWLARQQDAWSYATSGMDPSGTAEQLRRDWETGNHASRLYVLQCLRQSAPEQARAWLDEVWQTERAPQRVELLQTLAQGLCLEDEPFLESCLDDRSMEVRSTAARLLAGLSASRLCQRMQERVGPLLSYAAASGRLDVTLPTAFDPAWERDGIRSAPPAGSRARRADQVWWLQQMLGLVPPSWWTQRWAVAPSDLLASAAQHTRSAMLHDAWSHATVCQRDANWAEALLSGHTTATPELWPVLSTERRETLWGLLWSRATANAQRALLEQLQTFPGPWSAPFALQVGHALGVLIAQQPSLWWYEMHSLLQACALCMPPEVHDALAQAWEPHLQGAGDAPWSKGLTQLCETLRFRGSYVALHGGMMPA